MSSGGNRTIRYVNTGEPENNNRLIVLDRGQIIEPQPTPGAIGGVSSELELGTDGAVIVSDPANGDKNIKESVVNIDSYGDVTGLNSLTIEHSGFDYLINSPTLTEDLLLTLPDDAGLVNDVLSTDGAGILSWTTDAGGNVHSDSTLTVNNSIILTDTGGATTRSIKESTPSISASVVLEGLEGLNIDGTEPITLISDEKINIEGQEVSTTAVIINASDASGGVSITSGAGGIRSVGDGVILSETSAIGTSSIRMLATNAASGISLECGSNATKIINGGSASGLWLGDDGSAFFQKLFAASLSSDLSLTFPDDAGTSGDILTTDGAGILTWDTTSGTSPDSTGIISGGSLSINVDDTKFDISDGEGVIYNTVTQTKVDVTWSGLTAQSTVYVGDETFISIDSGGLVIFNTTIPTNSDMRDQIYLGQIVHLNQINILATIGEQMTVLSIANQIRDFMQAIGELKITGNICSSNSLLTITKTAGQILSFGGNFQNDIDNPHLPVSGALDTNVADVFAYRWQDGSSRLSLTDIVPGEYDDGNGEASPGSVGMNQWTVQRIFTFSIGQMVIQQGQFLYGNKDDAIAAIENEGFIVEPELAVSGVLISFLAVKGNATNLSDSATAQFLEAAKFGGSSPGTASGVNAPASSTDNAIARFDGTAGTTIQNSSVLINDSNNISGLNAITTTGATGTMLLETSNASADAIKFNATAGGIDLTADDAITIDSDQGLRLLEGSLGGIHLLDSVGGTNELQLRAAQNMIVDLVLTMPSTNGVANGYLRNSGSGTLSFRAPLPPGYCDGMGLAFVNASGVNVKAGVCTDSTDVENIELQSAQLCNFATTGAGGLQATEVSTQMYKIYVIADTTGVNVTDAFGVPQGTAIILPSGYDIFRLMGFVKNESGSIIQFVMHNPSSRSRHYQYQVARGTTEVYDSTGTANVFTSLDLGDFIPEGTSMVDFNVHVDMDADTDKFYMQSGVNAQSTTNAVTKLGAGIQAVDFEFFDLMVYNQAISPTGGTSGQPSVEWATSQTGQDVQIVVSAYTFNI